MPQIQAVKPKRKFANHAQSISFSCRIFFLSSHHVSRQTQAPEETTNDAWPQVVTADESQTREVKQEKIKGKIMLEMQAMPKRHLRYAVKSKQTRRENQSNYDQTANTNSDSACSFAHAIRHAKKAKHIGSCLYQS
jgi:hypothetical protein